MIRTVALSLVAVSFLTFWVTLLAAEVRL